MKVIVATNSGDIERLTPVALQWKESCNGMEMGIVLVPETHFADLMRLIGRDDAELFLLVDDDREEVFGYMGVECFNSPLGPQRIAQEHYWYVSEGNRGRGTILLIRAVEKWAKEQGCTHLIMNASTLASDLHDKVCDLYERIGMKKFETSYICLLRR